MAPDRDGAKFQSDLRSIRRLRKAESRLVEQLRYIRKQLALTELRLVTEHLGTAAAARVARTELEPP